jgi:hypothetical protein
MTHDQNFKNLILDYPREAIALFAAAEAQAIDADAWVTPVRQEQRQERLGERFRELDIPLLVEWPDGRREAILFVIEEETEPAGSPSIGSRITAWISRSCWTRSGWCRWWCFLHRGLSEQLTLGGDARGISRLPLPGLCAAADSRPGSTSTAPTWWPG